jgi:hypothetical protein
MIEVRGKPHGTESHQAGAGAMAISSCATEFVEPERFWRSSTMHSALVSMVCHLAAFIAFGLLTVAVQQGDGGVSLFSEMVAGIEAPTDDSHLLSVEEVSDGGGSTAAGPETLFTTDAFASAELDGPKVELPVAPVAAGLGGEGIGEEGDGRIGLLGDGDGAANFFGIVGTGKTFVYVLDCSDSMNDSDRFRRARDELVYSIEKLRPDQNFFVILYNDGAMPMDADDPAPATPREFKRFRYWLEKAAPSGGTNPLPALEYALSFNPDAIYFLSDGEFEPIVIAALRDKNRKSKLMPRRVPIHTIAFASQAGENQMKIIARTSGGKYRFVK